MNNVIENERQFKSINKFFWFFVAGLPILVLLRFFVNNIFIEYFAAVYALFFLSIWLVARFVAFPSYFYFKYDSDMISVKFRPFNFFDSFGLFKKNGISNLEISKNDYEGYKIQQKYAGLRRSLILYKRSNGEKTQGRAINISFLTITEITHLIRALHTFKYKKVS